MRYKEDTLKEFEYKAIEKITEAENRITEIHVHIAKGNKKVGRIRNVSIMPYVCCGNCASCKRYCYDIKAAIQYKNVMTARAENTALARKDPERFFEEIKNSLNERIKRKYMRWHVGGEILDIDYLKGMIKVACEKPNFKFWTYTKMWVLVNSYIANGGFIPDNLTILYSIDRDSYIENPYGMPIAYTVLPGDTAPASCMKCPGNCETCIEKQIGCPFGYSVYFDEH